MSHTNAISWFEVPVKDIDRAQQFYETVIGQAMPRQMFPMGDKVYPLAIFPSEGDGAKGCLQSCHDTQQPTTQGTVVYLNCGPSIDAAVARATDAGASVLKPKTALPPGMGFFAHVQDLDGNRVGLHALA